jgi:hypothetical protein
MKRQHSTHTPQETRCTQKNKEKKKDNKKKRQQQETRQEPGQTGARKHESSGAVHLPKTPSLRPAHPPRPEPLCATEDRHGPHRSRSISRQERHLPSEKKHSIAALQPYVASQRCLWCAYHPSLCQYQYWRLFLLFVQKRCAWPRCVWDSPCGRHSLMTTLGVCPELRHRSFIQVSLDRAQRCRGALPGLRV